MAPKLMNHLEHEKTRRKESYYFKVNMYFDLLSEIGKLGAKLCSTSMNPNMQLTKKW